MVLNSQPLSLFPTYALPRLLRRGRKWSRLVERVSSLPETHPEAMAYTLTMRRLAHKVGPTSHGLCFMSGCATCAQEVLERFDGSERELLSHYRMALDEINAFMADVEKQVRIAA